MSKKPRALVVGGTSGLGWEMATRLVADYDVVVTGRKAPEIIPGIEYLTLELSDQPWINIKTFVGHLPEISLLVYAAGFFQDGTITDIDNQAITDMLDVGLVAPVCLTRELLLKQGKLDGHLAITSTSQFIPRLREPMYTAVKAGQAAFSHSLSLDPRVVKSMVAVPAGMKTPFWENAAIDTTDFLDPAWVADKILKAWQSEFRYQELHLLRQPTRTEIATLEK